MSLLSITFLLLAVFWMAYSNGANDNFKGVATLYGSGTASYKKALTWATVTTVAGGMVSLIAVEALVKAFSGKGIIADELLGSSTLLLSIGLGTAGTIFLATLLGMPTSTTHALTGSFVGIAWVSTSQSLPWGNLFQKFMTPLLVSPFIAIVFSAFLYSLFRSLRIHMGVTSQTCLCLKNGSSEPVVQKDGSLVLASTGVTLHVDQINNCSQQYTGTIAGVDIQKPVNALHYLSGGAVCFSRAVNDTPKIAAVLLATPGGYTHFVLGFVAIAMAAGGLINSRKVAETMSKNITSLNTGQGVSANLATAALVLFASKLGVPVSTTHVSCGTLFGISLVNRSGRWKTIVEIFITWLITFPLGALIAGLVFLALKS